jgi:cell division septation protein DedD
MRNPLNKKRKKIYTGSEGMRLLWTMFPQAAFFEVFVPVKEDGVTVELPLIIESTEARLVEPYTKMFYRLFTARDDTLSRLLFLNVNSSPAVSRRVAANLAITLASEEFVTYLVELDMIEPAMHKIFHVDEKPGVVEFLLKGASADDIVKETGVPELKFVPSGKPLSDPDEILSFLGWSDTIDRMIPPGAVSLIYAGTGKSFKLDELLSQVDGTILLFSSGENIDRTIKKELKRIKKRSDIVGVIWTNSMEYPYQRKTTLSLDERYESEEEFPEEEKVPVVETQHTSFESEEMIEQNMGGEEVESENGGGKPDGEEESVLGGSGEKGPDEEVTEAKMEEESPVEEEEMTEAKPFEESPVEEEEMTETRIEEEDPTEEEEVIVEVEELDGENRIVFASSEVPEEKRVFWLPIIGTVLGVAILWGLYSWLGSPKTEPPQEVATVEVAPPEVPAADVSGGETVISGEDVPAEMVDEGVQIKIEGVAPAEGEGDQPPPWEYEGIVSQAIIEEKTIKGYSLTEASDVPYSLVLASYKDASSAGKGQEALRRAGFDSYVVPVEIPNLGRWNRLMTGQYHNREDAAAALAAVSEGSSFDQGRIIRSSFSYFLGAFGSLDEVKGISSGVRNLGLDTYILASETGEEIYFLYLGAFENEKQAAVIGEKLESLSIKRELVERKGLSL